MKKTYLSAVIVILSIFFSFPVIAQVQNGGEPKIHCEVSATINNCTIRIQYDGPAPCPLFLKATAEQTANERNNTYRAPVGGEKPKTCTCTKVIISGNATYTITLTGPCPCPSTNWTSSASEAIQKNADKLQKTKNK